MLLTAIQEAVQADVPGATSIEQIQASGHHLPSGARRNLGFLDFVGAIQRAFCILSSSPFRSAPFRSDSAAHQGYMTHLDQTDNDRPSVTLSLGQSAMKVRKLAKLLRMAYAANKTNLFLCFDIHSALDAPSSALQS